jgi:hypothetical protein
MADEFDPKVSQRYRDLSADVPPEALDQAILAAARRAGDKPHAPLVTPAGRHRWYFGLAAAAILLLAVAVTVHMEPRPDGEAVVSDGAPATRPQPQVRQAPREREERAADPAVRPAPAPVPERAESQSGPSAEAKALARLAETPEQWLERIAQLRKEGRSEEADRQLAEFRKRYPDYPIPEKK